MNQEELRSLTGSIYPVSEYEHDSWMETVARSQNKKVFLISRNEDEKNIGTIGLKNIDFVNSHAELFISIGDSSSRTCGYGTDAVITLTDYAFKTLNIHKVYLHVFESNIAAIKCYEKAGFRSEGVLREHHYSNGQYEDTIIMGKLFNSH